MKGLAPITLETAIALERVTGMPSSFWNRREADYREGLLRAKQRTLDRPTRRGSSPCRARSCRSATSLPRERPRTLFESVSPSSPWRIEKRTSGSGAVRPPVSSVPVVERAGRRRHLASDRSALGQPVKVAPFSASVFRKVLSDIRSLTVNGDPITWSRCAAQPASLLSSFRRLKTVALAELPGGPLQRALLLR